MGTRGTPLFYLMASWTDVKNMQDVKIFRSIEIQITVFGRRKYAFIHNTWGLFSPKT